MNQTKIQDGPAPTIENPLTKLIALALIIQLFAVSMITAYLDPNMVTLLISLAVWPVSIGLGATFATLSRKHRLVRLTALLVGLGMPFLAHALLPVTTPMADGIRNMERHAKVRKKEKQLDFLQSHLSQPREVIGVKYPYVIINGGYSLRLYDTKMRPENRDVVQQYLETDVLGKTVTASFPEEVRDRYHPNTRHRSTAPYATRASRNYGDAFAWVRVDDRWLNQEIRRRWGYKAPTKSDIPKGLHPSVSVHYFSSPTKK